VCSVLAVWVFSESGLSTSLPWCLRPSSIKPVFYWHPMFLADQCGLFLGCFSGLDAFSPYNLARGCTARLVRRPLD